MLKSHPSLLLKSIPPPESTTPPPTSNSPITHISSEESSTKNEDPVEFNPPEINSPNSDNDTRQIHKGRLLGRGGMGTVYTCRMEGERGNLALKIVDVPREGKKRSLALQEVKLLGSLDHPNIVPLVAVNWKSFPISEGSEEVQEEVWMVMELFDDSLKGIITNKKKGKWFREKDLFRWLTEIMKGLEYLHGKGIAHRDIKVILSFNY